jgi:hypothetical protein
MLISILNYFALNSICIIKLYARGSGFYGIDPLYFPREGNSLPPFRNYSGYDGGDNPSKKHL